MLTLSRMECKVEETNEPIVLSYSNGSVFVWDVNDVYRLRTKHRIVGNYIGCLPSLPRQDQLLGLPLELSPEEVFLLLSKRYAKLAEFKELDNISSAAAIEERSNIHKESFVNQAVLFKEERKVQLLSMKDKIIEGKRKKYQNNLKSFDEALVLEEEINKIPKMTEELMMIQIFTRPHWTCIETPRDMPTEQGKHSAKCLVFMDLWEKGYYMTAGEKFGGDFLVYPGDPVRFHSHYIAVCVNFDEKINPYYIVSKGRLGTNVKKTVLLCSVTKFGQINYQSLNWCGK